MISLTSMMTLLFKARGGIIKSVVTLENGRCQSSALFGHDAQKTSDLAERPSGFMLRFIIPGARCNKIIKNFFFFLSRELILKIG